MKGVKKMQMRTIEGATKRLSAVICNPSGKVSRSARAKAVHRACRMSGMCQTLLFAGVDESTDQWVSRMFGCDSSLGETCLVFEIYDPVETCLIHRIGYRLRELVAAAFAYMHLGDPFVSFVLEVEE